MTFATTKKLLTTSCACGLLLGGATSAQAWTSSSISLLYGWDYEIGEEERSMATFEMANGWEYGDNYFFFDYTNLSGGTTAGNPTLYGEFAPRLSFGKLTGRDLSFGPVKDVLLAGQLEMGDDINRRLYGLGFDLAVPGMDYFQFNIYARDDLDKPGDTWQTTLVWGSKFDIADTKWFFKGHFDYAGSEGETDYNVNAAPQLLLDVGNFWNSEDRLYAGVEYQIWRNKFGIKDADENNPQLIVTWKL